jgi:hypothetical protein
MKHITNMVRADGVLCFVLHASIEMMMMEFFFLQELFPLKNGKKPTFFQLWFQWELVSDRCLTL